MGGIKYRAAEEMKDSGVEMIGRIPKDWVIRRVNHVAEVIDPQPDHRAPSLSEYEGYPYVGIRDINDDGTINYESCRKVDLVAVLKQERAFKIRDIDIVFCRVATLGFPKFIKNDERVALSATLAIIKPKNIHPDFLRYSLESNLILRQMDILSTGSTRKSLGMDTIRKFNILVMTDEKEQINISEFLNSKTSQFDSIISKKEQLIRKLEEAKKSLISEVVTGKVKIIDGEMVERRPGEMMDSGVEWLGMIPEDWKVKKVKYFTTKVNSGKTPKGGSEVYTDDGIIFLRSQNIHNNGIQIDDVVRIDKITNREMINSMVEEHDILLNITGASIGRSAMFNIKCDANVNQHVCIIRLRKDIRFKEFYLYLFQSSFLQDQIMSYQTGTSREGLNFEQIKSLLFTHPKSNDERGVILHFLRERISYINNIVSKNKLQIQELKQAKQSLISEAVTGKIDLRDWEIIEEGE